MDYTIQYTDAEEKAMNHVCISISEWLENIANVRAQKAVDEVCEKIIGDDETCFLTGANKEIILEDMQELGEVYTTVRDLPQNIKKKIIELATVETAAQKNERLMDSQKTGEDK